MEEQNPNPIRSMAQLRIGLMEIAKVVGVELTPQEAEQMVRDAWMKALREFCEEHARTAMKGRTDE